MSIAGGDAPQGRRGVRWTFVAVGLAIAAGAWTTTSLRYGDFDLGVIVTGGSLALAVEELLFRPRRP